MLSYLKDAHQQTPADEHAAGDPNSGICRQDDFLTVSGHSKKLRQSTLMLGILFAVSAVVVWFMVKKITPAAATAAPSESQNQIEAALAHLDTMQTEVNTQMDSVVGKFYQFSNVEQVEVNQLKKNPFMRELSETQNTDDRNLGEIELNEIRKNAQLQAAQMELWSITSTPQGRCCMIGDKVLFVGDSMNDMTVKTIQEKSVTLEYNGVQIELKISE